MNKPIRTISIFCLILFLALMINASYLQYWKSGSLDDDPRNRRAVVESYSRERGAIQVGRNPVAESVPVRRPVPVPAHLPEADGLRPGHRLVLLLQPDRHRVHPERPALRRGREPVRDPARRPGQQRADQGRQRAADHRPGRAAGGVRRAQGGRPGRAGRRGRDPAEHRQDPGDGVAADVRPEPAGLPRPRRRPGRLRAARRGPDPAAAEPGDPDPAAPGLDVQGGHRGGRDREGPLHRGRRRARRGDLPAAADRRDRPA